MARQETHETLGYHTVRFPLLAPFTVLYLVLPSLAFSLGWLKTPWAVASVILLTAVLAVLAGDIRSALRARGTGDDGRQGSRWITSKGILRVAPAALLILAWTLWSGTGGFGFQNEDYLVSNSLFKALIVQNWPVTMVLGGAVTKLVYYTGYYLPAAAFGKWTGWAAANVFLLLWTLVGCYLAFAWFTSLTRIREASRPGRLFSLAVIFSLAGGLDLIGFYVLQGHPFSWTQHIERWAGFFQYSSETTLLYWVPQHAIAAWLLIGLTDSCLTQPQHLKYLGIGMAAALLWSPFGVVGAVPFVVLVLVDALRRGRLRSLRSRTSLLLHVSAAWLGLIVGLYYAANRYTFPAGLLWGLIDNRAALLKSTLAFWCLEFGALALLVAVFLVAGCRVFPAAESGRPGQRLTRLTECLRETWHLGPGQLALALTGLSVLVVLPLFKVGIANDLVMRGSIPALFVFWAFVAKVVIDAEPEVRRRLNVLYAAILLVIAVGFFPSIAEISRSVASGHFGPPDARSVAELGSANDPLTMEQRAGDDRALFFRYLGK